MEDKPITSLIKSTDSKGYKSDFIKFLDLIPDDYSDTKFTPQELNKIRLHLQYLSTGSSAAIPLTCGGSAKCPFASKCPLNLVNKAPLGKSCLIELNLLNEWTRLYIYEYDIDEHSFTEIQMVRELAEIELMLWRLNNNLSKPEHAELIEDVVVGVDKNGEALTRRETSALFDAKERLVNRKSRLIKLMVGDRQEKYKREAALKQKSVEDPSSTAAELRGRIDKLIQQARIDTRKLSEVEGNVIEVVQDTPLTPNDIISNSTSEE